MNPTGRIMITAGEASGDHHGARLITALKRLRPDIAVTGIGGDRMAAAGMEILVDAATLSVVGITEVLARIPQIRHAMRRARAHLKQERPDLLILIDYPDFNLRLARYAREIGIRVLYYISPQIWAWRAGRVRKIARIVDHMAVILPFEAPFYSKHRVPVTFVGHPILEDHTPIRPETWCRRLQGAPCIGLLPGSRPGEVRTLLPVMLQAAERIRSALPRARILLSRAASLPDGLLESLMADHSPRSPVTVVRGVGPIHDQAWCIITASGTATLETALAGVPMVVIYKVSPLSYLIGRALIRVAHIALVNLIAGRRLVPELIQHAATPERIAAAALEFTMDPAHLRQCNRDLLGLYGRLGADGASERTARIALKLMETPPAR